MATIKNFSAFHRKVYWWILSVVFVLMLVFILFFCFYYVINQIPTSQYLPILLPFVVGIVLVLSLLGIILYTVMHRLGNSINKERERVLLQQEEQALIKRQLTLNIAHELKTPVTSIQGYLETIISNPDMPEPTKNNFIMKGYAQSQRLSSLLHDITYLSRIDEAPELIEKEEVDITSILEGVIIDLAIPLKEREITIFNLIDNRDMICNGNFSLLYSVFRNLIENSIAYAGEKVSIMIDCKEDKDFFYFSYADNGVGVPEEHLTRIFERFYRLDKGRSRKLGGTGLGLAIVKNAVLFHHGQIIAKKFNDNGLEFLFSIGKR
ncbi:MAG: HAMP domain-containing histidine kinase [Bacteroidales bacterium]|jgi:two-component system OmpR family sensor kinase/two-component system phosphate regulon sensor histidine kinase PhoR|nr:HAMP domain-containing histidine kinase [Bacteroidales bacterium]